jgi:hypothetical protein
MPCLSIRLSDSLVLALLFGVPSKCQAHRYTYSIFLLCGIQLLKKSCCGVPWSLSHSPKVITILVRCTVKAEYSAERGGIVDYVPELSSGFYKYTIHVLPFRFTASLPYLLSLYPVFQQVANPGWTPDSLPRVPLCLCREPSRLMRSDPPLLSRFPRRSLAVFLHTLEHIRVFIFPLFEGSLVRA